MGSNEIRRKYFISYTYGHYTYHVLSVHGHNLAQYVGKDHQQAAGHGELSNINAAVRRVCAL